MKFTDHSFRMGLRSSFADNMIASYVCLEFCEGIGQKDKLSVCGAGPPSWLLKKKSVDSESPAKTGFTKRFLGRGLAWLALEKLKTIHTVELRASLSRECIFMLVSLLCTRLISNHFAQQTSCHPLEGDIAGSRPGCTHLSFSYILYLNTTVFLFTILFPLFFQAFFSLSPSRGPQALIQYNYYLSFFLSNYIFTVESYGGPTVSGSTSRCPLVFFFLFFFFEIEPLKRGIESSQQIGRECPGFSAFVCADFVAHARRSRMYVVRRSFFSFWVVFSRLKGMRVVGVGWGGAGG